MATISNVKRLIKEDFPKESQDLVDKLAYILNPFLDQVSAAFNKNINIDNLSREIVTATVVNVTGTGTYTVNGIATGGDISPTVQIKTKLANKVFGINVIRADNLTNSSTYPINAIGLSWSYDAKIITLNKITGIKDGDKYSLVLELIS